VAGGAQAETPTPPPPSAERGGWQRRLMRSFTKPPPLTHTQGMYMGGAHHDVGGLSRKRSTQYVGHWGGPKALHPALQPKGHWGNSENTGGDPHGRRQGKECVCTNGAAGRQTQLEELKNTNTRGARQLESRLDLHARGTKGGYRWAFSGIWLRGLSPAGKVLTGCSACGYAARSSLRSRHPSGPKTKTPI
jgi:hypothetical protein